MKLIQFYKQSRFLVIVIYLVCSSTIFSQTKLISFEIEDQFSRSYTDESWSDSVLVFIGSDKSASEYASEWGKYIFDTLREISPQAKVKIIGIADVSGVPFFLTGIVKSFFPDDLNHWTLLDWDDQFSDAYQFIDDSCNILIFNQERLLIYQTTVLEINKNRMNDIMNSIMHSAKLN